MFILDSETNKNELSDDTTDDNDNNCDTSNNEVVVSEIKETNNNDIANVNVEICIEEARNLPYLRNKGKGIIYQILIFYE